MKAPSLNGLRWGLFIPGLIGSMLDDEAKHRRKNPDSSRGFLIKIFVISTIAEKSRLDEISPFRLRFSRDDI